MKNKKLVILLVTLVLLLFSGVVVVLAMQKNIKSKDNAEQTINSSVRTFADWTDIEVFQNVPAMIVEATRIGKATDQGNKNYVIDVDGSSLEDYQNYLKLLEKDGFKKHIDNGEHGLAEAVYTATYTKEDIVLTISHVINISRTYISACSNAPLSEHLLYSDSYIADNNPDAKTKIHMLELYDYGNSFIIELKNGHFILMDGGNEEDGKYLLDYLETLVPAGQKPIVEAWIISHAHIDHMGALKTVIKTNSDASRIYVEGIYFNQPSDDVCGTYEPATRALIQTINTASMYLKTSEGQKTEIYRMQTGQRYYFNDLTMDVAMSQDMLMLENYSLDFNDSSSWLVFEIDGQKCLFGGDGDDGGMHNMMRTYGKDYMVFDIFQALHHSRNTSNVFTDYCTAKTVLVAGPELYDIEENKYLAEAVDEVIGWKDGGKVLTMPYQKNTVESLPMIEWIYHPKRATEVNE